LRRLRFNARHERQLADQSSDFRGVIRTARRI
jgi:hypothetical protein